MSHADFCAVCGKSIPYLAPPVDGQDWDQATEDATSCTTLDDGTTVVHWVCREARGQLALLARVAA